MSDTKPPFELSPFPREAHKGDRGAALIVAGSRLYAGAAALACVGAAHGGAGYVRAAVPGSIAAEVRGALPSVIAVGLRETSAGEIAFPALAALRDLCARADAVAIGPGLIDRDALGALLSRLVPDVAAPVVLDADALNALAGRHDVVTGRAAPTVLTPHPGEAARWLGTTTADVQSDREAAAARMARDAGAVVALKGAATVISDGERSWVNDTGNPGLATGGSGDVLTGVVTALLARGLAAWDAARLGVWLHGRAADIAVETVGESSLTPRILCEALPAAIQEATA